MQREDEAKTGFCMMMKISTMIHFQSLSDAVNEIPNFIKHMHLV